MKNVHSTLDVDWGEGLTHRKGGRETTIACMTELATADPPSPPPLPTHTTALWTLRALSLVALGISGYLAWLAITGQTAAGCGKAGSIDCGYVLSSRWAYVSELPVSVPAASLWLTVLAVSLFAGQAYLPGLRRAAWVLLTVLTTAAAGAALWFVGLQAFKLHHWCLYCLAAHACAVASCALVLWQREVPASPKSTSVLVGVCLAIALPMAQKYLPRGSFYALDVVNDVETTQPLVIGESKGRAIEVLGGAARISVAASPRLGDADGKYVVVSLYDYACGHCRLLHQQLLAAQREYQGQLTIVMLPTPLSHRCNPHITEQQSTSPDACELAKLALIVSALAPGEFAAYDAWLFEPTQPRTAAEARAKAVELVGEDALATSESDPTYAARLQQHIALYDRSPAGLLPQILGRNVVLSEGVESTGELVEALEIEFGFPRP